MPGHWLDAGASGLSYSGAPKAPSSGGGGMFSGLAGTPKTPSLTGPSVGAGGAIKPPAAQTPTLGQRAWNAAGTALNTANTAYQGYSLYTLGRGALNLAGNQLGQGPLGTNLQNYGLRTLQNAASQVKSLARPAASSAWRAVASRAPQLMPNAAGMATRAASTLASRALPIYGGYAALDAAVATPYQLATGRDSLANIQQQGIQNSYLQNIAQNAVRPGRAMWGYADSILSNPASHYATEFMRGRKLDQQLAARQAGRHPQLAAQGPPTPNVTINGPGTLGPAQPRTFEGSAPQPGQQIKSLFGPGEEGQPRMVQGGM